MALYKRIVTPDYMPPVVIKVDDNAVVSIPFDPANTDYQQFKAAIAEGTAELQDAEGNTMTAEDAQAFVATLP